MFDVPVDLDDKKWSSSSVILTKQWRCPLDIEPRDDKGITITKL